MLNPVLSLAKADLADYKQRLHGCLWVVYVYNPEDNATF